MDEDLFNEIKGMIKGFDQGPGPLHPDKILAMMPIAIAITDMEGHFLWVNELYCKIVGYSYGELLQMSFWDITPKEFHSNNRRHFDSGVRFGRMGWFEKPYIRKNKQTVMVRIKAQFYEIDDSKICFTLIEPI